MAEPVLWDQILKRERGQNKMHFLCSASRLARPNYNYQARTRAGIFFPPLQLTTSRIDYHARLINTLLLQRFQYDFRASRGNLYPQPPNQTQQEKK